MTAGVGDEEGATAKGVLVFVLVLVLVHGGGNVVDHHKEGIGGSIGG